MRRGTYLALAALVAGIALPLASPVAEEPELHGVSQEGPPVERKTQGEAHRSENPTEPTPIAVRIVQSVDEAADAKAREAKADEHDAKDLETQIRGVDAAVSQKWAAWTGVGLSAVGALLLLFTLWYTRRAIRTAELANALTRAALEADRRPWVSVKAKIGGDLTWAADGGTFYFRFRLKNVGPSPAIQTDVRFDILMEPSDLDLHERQRAFADEELSRGHFLGRTIFPGEEIEVLVGITVPRESFISSICGDANSAYALIVLIGCVTYQGTLSEGTFETGFIYHIERLKGDQWLAAIGPIDVNIDEEELAIREWLRPGRIT